MKCFLAAAALTVFWPLTRLDAKPLCWAAEDANGDGFWNYSVTNWNFVGSKEWGNVPMIQDAYEGQSALSFQYLNQDLTDNGTFTQAFGFALIPSSDAFNGWEPTSSREYEAGRNLRPYDTLQFFIKGTPGANQSAFHVWMRSPNGHGSVLVPMKNYVTVTDSWQRVVIPVRDFLPELDDPTRFQLTHVHALGFYVTQNDANVPFNFLVDNISFVNSAELKMPDVRYWWREDANQNGTYNYSTTVMQKGSTINVANQWNDVVTGFVMTGPMGTSQFPSVDLRFEHNGLGYAAANLTTSRANHGWEPESFADRDSGKVIEATQASLNFSAPGLADGLRVKLIDQKGRSSRSVNIQDYRSSYGRYAFTYSIPNEAFADPEFDWSAVQSVSFFVDEHVPAGLYQLRLMNLFFKRN